MAHACGRTDAGVAGADGGRGGDGCLETAAGAASVRRYRQPDSAEMLRRSPPEKARIVDRRQETEDVRTALVAGPEVGMCIRPEAPICGNAIFLPE
jgi:hypothetical protein